MGWPVVIIFLVAKSLRASASSKFSNSLAVMIAKLDVPGSDKWRGKPST